MSTLRSKALPRNSFESKQYTLGVYFDLSKDFDTVNLKILISKLENYGIKGKNLLWFISYLTNQRQFIKYNNLNTSFQKRLYVVFCKAQYLDLYFLFTLMTLKTHQKVWIALCSLMTPIFFILIKISRVFFIL